MYQNRIIVNTSRVNLLSSYWIARLPKHFAFSLKNFGILQSITIDLVNLRNATVSETVVYIFLIMLRINASLYLATTSLCSFYFGFCLLLFVCNFTYQLRRRHPFHMSIAKMSYTRHESCKEKAHLFVYHWSLFCNQFVLFSIYVSQPSR